MVYPYDSQLDEETLAFLTAFRTKYPGDKARDKVTALISDEMPSDLKAWLHTYSYHGGLISIGDLWLDADKCMPLAHLMDGYEPDELEEAQYTGVAGMDLQAAVVMASTADGEVSYAAAWAEGDSKLTLVTFCMAGYEDDGFIAKGSMMNALRGIASKMRDSGRTVDEEVRELLLDSEAGEGEAP